MDCSIKNQTNFAGKLVQGRFLSKNFEKYVPELSAMLKDKPYDVFAEADCYCKKNGRIHRTTYFGATNFSYFEKTQYKVFKAVSSTNKTKYSSYKAALQNVIDTMDKSIEDLNQNNKKLSLKETISKTLDFIKNLFIR